MTNVFDKAIYKYLTCIPQTNIYGLARTILAAGTCLTLLANNTYDLFFTLSPTSLDSGFSFSSISIFNILSNNLVLGKWISIIILLTVMSGWKPRWTGLLHWWITYSFFASCSVIDGGDHLASVLTLLLVPISLTDTRNSHWDTVQNKKMQVSELLVLKNSVAYVFFFLIRLQVCVMYLHAAVGKMGVTEWGDGTAVYYWFTHPYYGMPDWLYPLFSPLLSNNYVVTTITWGTIVFELLLFAAILVNRHSKKRLLLLVFGILFHFNIVLFHGLISFFFSTAAGLILFLYPVEREYNVKFRKSTQNILALFGKKKKAGLAKATVSY